MQTTLGTYGINKINEAFLIYILEEGEFGRLGKM
jgi:hypothetical protein